MFGNGSLETAMRRDGARLCPVREQPFRRSQIKLKKNVGGKYQKQEERESYLGELAQEGGQLVVVVVLRLVLRVVVPLVNEVVCRILRAVKRYAQLISAAHRRGHDGLKSRTTKQKVTTDGSVPSKK
jgi:hypothetical protein